MPGSEMENTKSDTGKNKRRNSNTNPFSSIVLEQKHSPFLLSHILKDYSIAIPACQFSQGKFCPPDTENFWSV
jgi:hypothetical protein